MLMMKPVDVEKSIEFGWLHRPNIKCNYQQVKSLKMVVEQEK